MKRPSLSSALAAERPLVTPLAHDALSARLIQRAGFKAFAIGGSAMLAARFGLPDLGLIGLADMVAGSREIAEATSIPFLIDGDDGYGDERSVIRMVHAYERLGAGGILIEDQDRQYKQQRAERALQVVDDRVILGKLNAALQNRQSPATAIIGRTDAYGVLGLDAALRRAEKFIAIGVDGVFVAGLQKREDYERVGRELAGTRLSAAIFEGGGTPWITPAELGEMGFRHVSFPSTLIARMVGTLDSALRDLRAHATGTASMRPLADAEAARKALDDAVELARWAAHGARPAIGQTGTDSEPAGDRQRRPESGGTT